MRCDTYIPLLVVLAFCGCGESAPKKKVDLTFAEKVRKDRLEFVRASSVLAYDRIGHKDPRWDADAREALEDIAQVWSKYTVDEGVVAKGLEAAKRAIQSGCDDPLVLYVRGRLDSGSITDKERFYAAANANVALCDYAPERKANIHFRYAESIAARAGKSLTEPERSQVLKLWEEALKELARSESIADAQPDLKAETNSDTAIELIDLYTKYFNPDRKVGIEKVTQALAAAAPQSSTSHMVKGSAYISYAWDARGDGYANTVTNEGWKLMTERLEVSNAELETAWKLQPSSRIAQLMVRLALGRDQGRDAMEEWFKRAIELNPNNDAACGAKMYYLEPKWHGNAEEMLEFGRKCLETENWNSRIPLQLVSAHERLMNYAKPPENYFKDPEVWDDIKAVYEGYLKFDPNSAFDRSSYAYYACYCGHASEAHKQFQILGDKVSVEPFHGKQRMEEFRKEAAYRVSQGQE